MTWRDALSRAGAVLRWLLGHLEVLALVVVAIVAIGWAWACSRADTAEGALAAANERAQVTAAGVAVAQSVTREGLDRMLAAAAEREQRAARRASQLAAEVARLLAAAPGGHVVSVAHGDTGWIRTGGERAAPAVPEPAGGQASAPSGGSPPAGRACWFFAGDEGRILPVVVRAKYRTGRVVSLAGVAQAFGRPPGDTGEGRLLFGAPLTFDAAELEDLPPAPGRILGFGGGASTLTQRWQLSGLFLTRPARVPLLGRWRIWAFGAGGPAEGGKAEVLLHVGAAAEF